MAAAATAASEDGTDDSLMSGAAKWNERGAGTGTERNAMMRNGVGSETDRKKGNRDAKRNTQRGKYTQVQPTAFYLDVYTYWYSLYDSQIFVQWY